MLETSYFRRKRLPVASYFCFAAIMIQSAVFVLLDIFISVAAVYSDLFPEAILTVCLKMHTFILESIMLMIYVYVSILNDDRKFLSKPSSILAFVMFGISFFTNLFSRLNFQIIESRIYSTGFPVSISVFVTFAIAILIIQKTVRSMILTPVTFLRNKNRFIVWTMTVWAGVAAIQIIFQNNHISSFGITLMVLILNTGLDSTDDYVDRETESLNGRALELVLQEKLNSRKSVYILNLDIEGLEEIERNFGTNIKKQLLSNIADYLNFKYQRNGWQLMGKQKIALQYADYNRNADIYHGNPNCFTLLIPDTKKNFARIDVILEDLEKRMKNGWTVDDYSIQLKSHCDVIHFPKDLPENIQNHDLMKFIEQWHCYCDDSTFIRKAGENFGEKRSRQIQIEGMLKDAVKDSVVEVYFQPVFNVKEQKFTEAEALVRLQENKALGFISPQEFIPIAEKNGLMTQMGELIFRKIFRCMKDNEKAFSKIRHVGINLSGLQALDGDLLQLMNELMDKYEINPEKISMEIKESTLNECGALFEINMKRLKNAGYSFAMDNFGTECSNLSQMFNDDFEFIKIGEKLVHSIEHEKNKSEILLEDIIQAAEKSGKTVIAEGVETEEQFDCLKKLGVNYIQGYYFSKPLNEKDFAKKMEEQ